MFKIKFTMMNLLMIIACALGSFAAIALFSSSIADSLCLSGIILLAAAAVLCIKLVIDEVISPKIHHRKTAVKALGINGFRLAMTDKAAKTAFRGVYYFIEGKYTRAEETLEKALSMAENNNNRLFCTEWLRRVYEETGNDPKELWCMRRIVELAPDQPVAQSRLGHAYFVDGNLDRAMECFEQAIHFDPNHGFAYYNIAKIHMIRGEDDKAIEVLNKLLTINESHPLVYAELATIYAMHNDEEKSQEYYKKAVFCGYKEPEQLEHSIHAVLCFNCGQPFSGSDLPGEYYRRVEKEEVNAGNE